ncbi:MAG: carboxymuconolactone decarboxylase family protein [Methylotenera sp.]|nr:carboxymuconolactone decarboxylase family protein [Oligoflexia bacterium]
MSSLDIVLGDRSTAISRDLRLNLNRLLTEGFLNPTESALTLLATATSVEHAPLVLYAREKLAELGVHQDHVLEAEESAAIMGMLNTYYRFKHFIHNEEDYKAAGLRMTALAKPVLGKEQFEMLALAVSCINGCEMCVTSHEKVLRASGVTPDKIHDLARIASVVKGLKTLSTITVP